MHRRRLPLHLTLVVMGFTGALAGPSPAQEVLDLKNESRLIPSDLAVLEVPEPRDDLPCTVHPVRARVGFDLRFHAGYDVTIPLNSLAGNGNQLSILFRVSPLDGEGRAVFFTQRFNVPEIKEDARGDAYLQGVFDLGAGKYKIDWLMRDRRERVCSYYWDETAELDGKDKDISLVVRPNEIRPFQQEQFVEEQPVQRVSDQNPIKVKLMVNFAPQVEGSSVLQPTDTAALVSLLRCFWREPRIGKYSVVAFNLNGQKVIYRQENTDRIDFPAIGDALRTLDVGTVDLSTLSNKNAEGDFLGDLLKQELSDGQDPDAVIFVGPKATWGQKISSDLLKEIGRPGYPVFYMNCNLYPARAPWRDAIGSAVKSLDGEEYTISAPRDLWNAVSDVVSRIVKLKRDRGMALSSSR